jgi:hypothetical protein
MPQYRDEWKGWRVIGRILGISFVHLLLVLLAIPIFFIEFMIVGKATSYPVMETWLWVFATPLCILDVSGVGASLSRNQKLLLYIPNSLLYGVTWWFSWRMYKLIFQTESKREE